MSALDGEVSIERDDFGIPTVRATTKDDGWWGLGYAAAQDRLWQMEYDRRRATGRWAEVVGGDGLAADTLARRLQLAEAARRDVAAMTTPTRRSFECYAQGVNTAAASDGGLPAEYAATATPFEPWLPWHSIAAFKVRHVLMGAWQYKLARATLYATDGGEAFSEFDPVNRPGMRVSSPPGDVQAADGPHEHALLAQARTDVAAAAAELGFLAEVEAGSNAWVVAGSRTVSGKPLLCNDSHRAADVPNVYWQARLKTPYLTVAGATFPGIPGFPHFGHNGRVGWAITNAAADTQDLLVEIFRAAGDVLEVRTTSGWEEAPVCRETIFVRDAAPVIVECIRTGNGPVVHGDPRTGRALSLRWTATDAPCEQFGVLSEMLHATTVEELLDAQRHWVDPVNNLLCADTDGGIGYLLRGSLPVRSGQAAMQVPVPGWHEDSQWQGRVPFERMPREVDPVLGFIASGNNAVADARHGVEVSHSVNDFYRIERIHELLEPSTSHTPAAMQAMQADTVSIAARRWSDHLAGRGPYSGDAEQARVSLIGWEGDLAAERPAGLVYACFRRALAEVLLTARLSPQGQRLLQGADIPAGAVLLKRWFAQLIWPDSGDPAPATAIADSTLARALADGWADATTVGGPAPASWRWRDHHPLEPRHTLGDTFPSPTPVTASGDAETIQAAAYGWKRGSSFTITNCSVFRQVLDMSDLEHSRWVIPGGASGRPGDPHYEDQLPLWAAGTLLPLRPRAEDQVSKLAVGNGSDGGKVGR